MADDLAALTETVERAIAKRNKARAKKKFSVADELRDMLKALGVVVQDTGPTTSEWSWAKGDARRARALDARRGEGASSARVGDSPAPGVVEEEAPEESDASDSEEEAAPPPSKKRPAEDDWLAAAAKKLAGPAEGAQLKLKGGVVADVLERLRPRLREASSSTRVEEGRAPNRRDAAGGSGAKKSQRGKKITMKYRGTLAKNGREFDKGKIAFRLGAGEVIEGWDVGCAGMQIGERRMLHIPARMGYGADGAPPDIPRNADLDFDVTLMKC